MSTAAKIAPETGDPHKKIQLCVCFLSDDTQKLTLNYKETLTSESIEIITVETPIIEFERNMFFSRIKKIYNILNTLCDNGAKINFNINKNKTNIENITGIDNYNFKDIGYDNIDLLIKDINLILNDTSTTSLTSKPKIIQVVQSNQNDLETNGGYFDKDKNIIYYGKLNKGDTIKNLHDSKIDKINDDNTLNLKYNNNTIEKVNLQDIMFKDSDISTTTYNKSDLKAGDFIIAKKDDNNWYFGEIISLPSNDDNKYNIKLYERGQELSVDRENIRYIKSENGKIVSNIKGGSIISTKNYYSNTTKKKRRQRKKYSGKTCRRSKKYNITPLHI